MILILMNFIFLLIFNLILIPRFGAAGAVIGSIVAEGTISGLYVSFCDKYLSFKQLFKVSYKKLIAGIMMFVSVYLIGHLDINQVLLVICQILIGAAIYVLMLIIMRDKIIGFVFNTIKGIFKKYTE